MNICQSCKHKKLKLMNVQMRVGSIPFAIGTCEECKKEYVELYTFQFVSGVQK